MVIFTVRSESKPRSSRSSADGVVVILALEEFGPTTMSFRLGDFGN